MNDLKEQGIKLIPFVIVALLVGAGAVLFTLHFSSATTLFKDCSLPGIKCDIPSGSNLNNNTIGNVSHANTADTATNALNLGGNPPGFYYPSSNPNGYISTLAPWGYNMTLFSIGQDVIGGTNNNVLFIDGTGKVGQSDFFKYANAQLNLTQVNGIIPLLVSNATITDNLNVTTINGINPYSLLSTYNSSYEVNPKQPNAVVYVNASGSLTTNNQTMYSNPNDRIELSSYNGNTYNKAIIILNATAQDAAANAAAGSLILNSSNVWIPKNIIIQKASSQRRYLILGSANNLATVIFSHVPDDTVYNVALNGQPMIFINQTRDSNGGTNQVPFLRIMANHTAAQNAYLDWYVGGVDSTTKAAFKIYSVDADPEFCISNQKQGNIVACNGGAGAGGARFGVNSAGAGGRGAQFFIASSENAFNQWIGGFMFNNINASGDGNFKAIGSMDAIAEDEQYRYARLSFTTRTLFNDVTQYPNEKMAIYPDGKISFAQLSNTRIAGGGLGIGGNVANPDALMASGDIAVLGTVAQKTVFSDSSNTGITNGIWINQAGFNWSENTAASTGYNCTRGTSANGCTMSTVINTTAGMSYYIAYNVYSSTSGFNGSMETYYWLPSGKYFAQSKFGAVTGGNTYGFAFTAENGTTTIMLNTSAGAQVSRVDAFAVREYGIAKVKAGQVWANNITLRGTGNSTYGSDGGHINFWNYNGVIESTITHDAGTGWINITGTNSSLNVQKNLRVNGNFFVDGNVSLKRAYWSGYDNETQDFANTANVQVMNISNNADIQNYGINVVGNQNITFSMTGIYRITVSPEFHLTGAGTDKIATFWIQKNGVDVPFSNSRYTVNFGDYNAPMIEWIVSVSNTTSDSYRVVWWSDSTSMELATITGLTAPTRPSIPAVLTTINKLSELTP